MDLKELKLLIGELKAMDMICFAGRVSRNPEFIRVLVILTVAVDIAGLLIRLAV